jgi:hypothetical protein
MRSSLLARWHLLSLDAPSVAATWTWAVARACNLRLPWVSLVAMGVAVWMLYVTDRLLDARGLSAPPQDSQARRIAVRELEARHFFHYRHGRMFVAGLGLAALGLAGLMPLLTPAAVLLYAIEAAFLCGWFLVLHASNLHRTGKSHRLPKEIAVGLFFAAAVFIPTVAREPGLRPALLPVVGLLAGVCSLNCLFIYCWEHEPGRPHWRGEVDSSRCHASTRLALRHLFEIAAALATAGAGIAVLERLTGPGLLWTLPAACAVSVALLLLLHRSRRRIEPTTLRAAADVALITPLLFLPLLVR